MISWYRQKEWRRCDKSIFRRENVSAKTRIELRTHRFRIAHRTSSASSMTSWCWPSGPDSGSIIAGGSFPNGFTKPYISQLLQRDRDGTGVWVWVCGCVWVWVWVWVCGCGWVWVWVCGCECGCGCVGVGVGVGVCVWVWVWGSEGGVVVLIMVIVAMRTITMILMVCMLVVYGDNNNNNNNNNNNINNKVYLSCAHQRPERSPDNIHLNIIIYTHVSTVPPKQFT